MNENLLMTYYRFFYEKLQANIRHLYVKSKNIIYNIKIIIIKTPHPLPHNRKYFNIYIIVKLAWWYLSGYFFAVILTMTQIPKPTLR